jgi:nucleoside-diphosphate-sugar epimerase
MPGDIECDALIHCAYDFAPADWGEIKRKNVDGSIAILSSAVRRGIHSLFISSPSATSPRSLYGRAKREVERYSLDNAICVIRPGLITGPGGLYDKLRYLAETLPLIPLIGRGDQVMYLIKREDAARGIADIVDHKVSAEEPIELAYPQPYTLREILQNIAMRKSLKRYFVPVPVFLIRQALRTFSAVGLPGALREDNLNGLFSNPPAPSADVVRFTLQDPFC